MNKNGQQKLSVILLPDIDPLLLDVVLKLLLHIVHPGRLADGRLGAVLLRRGDSLFLVHFNAPFGMLLL